MRINGRSKEFYCLRIAKGEHNIIAHEVRQEIEKNDRRACLFASNCILHISFRSKVSLFFKYSSTNIWGNTLILTRDRSLTRISFLWNVWFIIYALYHEKAILQTASCAKIFKIRFTRARLWARFFISYTLFPSCYCNGVSPHVSFQLVSIFQMSQTFA